MSDNAIKARIHARRTAEAIWEFVEEGDHETIDISAYWQRISELYTEKFPPPETADLKPMTCQEAANFNLEKIPFGKNAGQYVGDVPLSYLCHLCDPSPFLNELRRYLKNPEVQRAIEEEGDE